MSIKPTKNCGFGLYSRRRPFDTSLYQIVQTHFETFLALCHDDWEGHAMPPHAEREFRRYLECGILAHGFARARCDQCGHDFLIAFSCKGRCVCPSCTTRRMAETAAHLVDHVFPPLPVRQWVVSFPKRLRYFLQRDGSVRSATLRIVLRVIERHLKTYAPGGASAARIGAVAFIHQFGSALNEHPHFHICVIDGVFEAIGEACAELSRSQDVRFVEAEIDSEVVSEVQSEIRRRVVRLFARRGLMETDDAKDMLTWGHGGGFSVDATVRIAGPDRQGLERLLRYCARPPFALERIEVLDEHRLIYHTPKPGPDGRTSVPLTPLELIGRLAALVPAPRTHRHRYYGVLAPNARLRSAVTALIPAVESSSPLLDEPGQPLQEQVEGEEGVTRSPARYLWAMLLARVYEVFPLTCPICGGSMAIIAFITDPPVVRRILHHIGEPSAPPRIAPARGPPDWESDGLGEGVQQDWEPEPEYEYDQRISW